MQKTRKSAELVQLKNTIINRKRVVKHRQKKKAQEAKMNDVEVKLLKKRKKEEAQARKLEKQAMMEQKES